LRVGERPPGEGLRITQRHCRGSPDAQGAPATVRRSSRFVYPLFFPSQPAAACTRFQGLGLITRRHSYRVLLAVLLTVITYLAVVPVPIPILADASDKLEHALAFL